MEKRKTSAPKKVRNLKIRTQNTHAAAAVIGGRSFKAQSDLAKKSNQTADAIVRNFAG